MAPNNKVVHLTKRDFLRQILYAASNAATSIETEEKKHVHLYYRGNTFSQTGDWAVLSDDRSEIVPLSLYDIYYELKSNDVKIAMCITIDAPCSGKWAIQMRDMIHQCNDVFTNIVIAASCGPNGQSDWFVNV